MEAFYVRINILFAEEEAVVKTLSGPEYTCSNIKVKGDSTSFVCSDNDSKITLPTSEIESIIFTDYSRFMFKNIGIGAANGLGAGLMFYEIGKQFLDADSEESLIIIPISVAAGIITSAVAPLIGGTDVIIKIN